MSLNLFKRCSACKLHKLLDDFFKEKKGHLGRCGYCKVCHAEKKKEYRVVCADKQHAYDKKRRQRESYKDAKKRDREKHREQRNAKTSEWHAIHPNYNQEYRIQNIEKLREYDRQRRERVDSYEILSKHARAYALRRKNAEGSFTPREWQDVCKKYDNCCAYCKKRTFLTRHHVIPLSRGGSNWITNILPACQSCNSRIGTKIIYPDKEVIHG